MRSLYVKEMTAAVEKRETASYRFNTKVTLEIEGDRCPVKPLKSEVRVLKSGITIKALND